MREFSLLIVNSVPRVATVEQERSNGLRALLRPKICAQSLQGALGDAKSLRAEFSVENSPNIYGDPHTIPSVAT